MMDVTDVAAAQRQLGVAELVRIPVRRWRTVLATGLLITAGTSAYLGFAPATHTATTVVVVRAVVTDPFTFPAGGADRAVNMTAENGIATGSGVVDKVAAATGRSAADVAARIEVENPVGGQVLRFRYDGGSTQEAALGANTAATTYLRLRAEMYEAQRTAVLASYDRTIAHILAERTAVQAGLPVAQPTGPVSPHASSLLDRIRSLHDRLTELSDKRSRIASADLSPGTVTSAARGPLPSSRDAVPLYLLAAVLGGLLLGALGAFLREAMDRRVRTADEASDATGVPVLGIVARGPEDAEANAADMRYLALAMAEWADRPDTGPLVLLSSRSDEGRTRVTAGLAAALAEAGHEVYLGGTPECADPLRTLTLAAQRRIAPVISRHRGRRHFVPDAAQLADALPGGRVPDAILAGSHVPDAILPSGRVPDAILAGSHVPDAILPGTTVPDGDAAEASQTGDSGRTDAPVVGALSGVAIRAGRTTRLLASDLRALHTGLLERLSAPIAEAADETIVHAVTPAVGSTPTDYPEVLPIGSGSVRLGPLEPENPEPVVLLDAPPAGQDNRGVWAARGGDVLLVVARDRTRVADLTRLVGRLRAAGVRPLGVVLTGEGRA